MTNLYYTPASGSVTSSLVILPENIFLPQSYLSEGFTLPSSSATYNNVTLTIAAGAYDTSGSVFDSTVGTLRAYISSGSNTIASYPLESVNIYYNQSLLNVPPPTQSVPTPDSASYLAYIDFQTNSLSASFNIYNITKASSSIAYSGSSNTIATILLSNDSHVFALSGSSTFYTSSITIIDTQLNITSSYLTASNSFLSTNFSASYISPYTILAQLTDKPYLKLMYGTGTYPVFDSSSLSDWNTYLNITASQLINSGSRTIYLIGGNLNSISNLYITGSELTNIYSSGLNSLISESIFSNVYLSSFPNISTLSSIKYLDYSNNDITGSIPNLDNNPLLSYLDIKNNGLSGLIPAVSNSQQLSYFDCSSNYLSGSIPNLNNNYSLSYFSCSSNYLTGSTPTLTYLPNLTNFNCSYNNLSGSINSISGAVSLTYFDCSHNYLTGSLPNLANNNIPLQTFICNNNRLTTYVSSSGGELSYVSPYLLYFDGSNNLLTTGSVNGIVKDLYYAGGVSGTLNLGGTGNAPCTNTVLKTNLINVRGWTVYTNDTHYITFNTASISSLVDSHRTGVSYNIGQTFSMFESGSLQNIAIYLRKDGSPDFDIQLLLYDQSANKPFNILATSSYTVAASSLLSPSSGSLINFTFDNYYLTGSASSTGSYAFGLIYSNIVTHDDSNFINVSAGAYYPYGTYTLANSSTPSSWANQSSDLKTTIAYTP
jgi:Leucine-rich repeat (LRR) protein